jgi:hypothetical protein
MAIKPPPINPIRPAVNNKSRVILGGGGYGQCQKQMSPITASALALAAILIVLFVWTSLAEKSRYDHMSPEEKKLQALVDAKPFKASNGLAYEADRYLQLSLNDYSSLEVVYSSNITLASDDLERPVWKQVARIRAANGFGAKTISDVTFLISGKNVQAIGLE